MEVYLDNSATTKCYESVKDIVVKTMMEDYGNPSAKHLKGVEAEKYIKESREIIAKSLKVNEKEILFTSGGTESDNLALIGAALANKRAGMHIISTTIEHPAVLEALKFLEGQGYRITRLPVDKQGYINLLELEAAICDDTILVSTMYVNNEIGTVLPIADIADIINKKNPNIIYHVDAIQAYGKFKIYPKRVGVDLLSVSGHKIHGPKGVGFLYKNEKVKIAPISFGGGQQKGMRSGTENVPGVAGLSMAVTEIYTDFDDKIQKMYELKRYFTDELSRIDQVTINGPEVSDGTPQIVSASFKGVRSEVLLHAMEDKGIYISSGSACSSNKQQSTSNTLKGIGLSKDMADSTVRFSFSSFTTKEELDYCLNSLETVVMQLRKYLRR